MINVQARIKYTLVLVNRFETRTLWAPLSWLNAAREYDTRGEIFVVAQTKR